VTSVAHRILEEALTLPERERRQITEALLDSMSEPSEEDEAWLDEVERRIEQARTGEAPSLDGDEVIARLRDKLRSIHAR
jgi:putative addiction module component (TIGR02574 family)